MSGFEPELAADGRRAKSGHAFYSAVREAFTAVCNLCGQRGAAYLLPRLEHLRRSLLSREEGPPAGVLDPSRTPALPREWRCRRILLRGVGGRDGSSRAVKLWLYRRSCTRHDAAVRGRRSSSPSRSSIHQTTGCASAWPPRARLTRASWPRQSGLLRTWAPLTQKRRSQDR